MPSINIDFSEVPDQQFGLIPKGNYDAIVDEVTVKKGKDSGEPYLNWKLKIVGGDYEGRVLFTITSFSGKALPGTKATLKTFGYDMTSPFTHEEDTAELQSNENYLGVLIDPDFAGKACAIKVGHRPAFSDPDEVEHYVVRFFGMDKAPAAGDAPRRQLA